MSFSLNFSAVDPDNARLWKIVVGITGPCSCHEAFRSRHLIAPDCVYHEYSLDIFDALLEERERGRKR